MPSTDELKERIEAALPGAEASVTGDGHHFEAHVRAAQFSGLSRIERHRLVNDVFHGELGARIHALSIKTEVPEEAPR
jgi:acid stress-induced BolA-like protein IbaG/YrbA